MKSLTEVLATEAKLLGLAEGGIINVSGHYWEDRVRRLGTSPLILKITIMAIQDALAPIPDPHDDDHRWKKTRIKDALESRWSAWRWLFNDYDDEYNFSDVCESLDIDLKKARCQIIYMWLTGAALNDFSSQDDGH